MLLKGKDFPRDGFWKGIAHSLRLDPVIMVGARRTIISHRVTYDTSSHEEVRNDTYGLTCGHTVTFEDWPKYHGRLPCAEGGTISCCECKEKK